MREAPAMEVSSRLELIDADAHHSRARVLHDRADIREVEVDETRDGDEVGNALNALTQRIVCDTERIEHASFLVDDLEQAIVRDDDERVDLHGKEVDALLCLVATETAFEAEGLRDDAYGKCADLFTGDLGNDWCSARARAAAFASSNEHHISISERFTDLCARFLCCLATDLRIRTCTQTARKLFADVDGLVCIREQQRLAIGIHCDEFNTAHARFNHAVDRVRAAAANSYNLDDCKIISA